MTMATSIPMDEIRGLVEERARYEAWLQARDKPSAACTKV